MSSKPERRSMDITQIMEVLPHRPPFLLVDRILELVPGRVAIGVKSVSMTEPHFVGHFPGHPVMPAVLITEFMAQVGGVLLLSASGNHGKLAYFAGIDKQRFRKPVIPGDLLVARVEMIAAKGHIGKVRAVAHVFHLETACDSKICEAVSFEDIGRNTLASVTVPGEEAGGRERQALLGLMEGELAAEGEMMFALVDRERYNRASD